MDLDDSDARTQVPSRVSRFAPKSSKKLNPKPKPQPKLEPQEADAKPVDPESAFCKLEPQEFDPATRQSSPKSETKEEPKFDDDPIKDEDHSAEESSVLREIDVFFSPSSIDPNTQLYVMQYPLRSWWRPYELDERCEEVRLKPESLQVEIDLSLDLESINYDKDQKTMTKQTLSSSKSWTPSRSSSHYVVGFFRGNKLYLHPIDAVLQLRPSLQRNINTAKKAKNIKETEEESTGKDQSWVSLKYHSSKSDVSALWLRKMLAHEETAPISFTMNPHDYVSSLCPRVSHNNTKSKGELIRSMLALPLQERLMKLLVEGRTLHRFRAVKYFAPEYSDDELLGFLQQHAIVVQGLWAPKSALLYPQGSVEDLARDYVLILFRNSLKVQFSRLNVRPEYSRRVRNFLNVFGVERAEDWKSGVQPVVYWKFRECPDVWFEKRYADVVEKQRGVLRGMEQRVFGEVHCEFDKSGGLKRSLKNIAIPSNPSKKPAQTRSVGKPK